MVSWINSTTLDVEQRCLVPIDFNLESWDLKFIAEVAYNISVNRIIGRSSQEIVHDFTPRLSIPIADYYKASESAYAFVSHVHVLHKGISDRIALNNANYKERLMLEKD